MDIGELVGWSQAQDLVRGESPVLFAGQYEDHESGWVYNRFRFCDPAGGLWFPGSVGYGAEYGYHTGLCAYFYYIG